jgi:hypothetical protein
MATPHVVLQAAAEAAVREMLKEFSLAQVGGVVTSHKVTRAVCVYASPARTCFLGMCHQGWGLTAL